MNRYLLLATTAAASVVAFGAANAQVNIYGGGSSLGYNEQIRTIDALAPTTNIYVNSTSGAAGEVFYNADGSGNGQKAFLTQDATVHSQRTGSVHFGASDAYLSAAQVACWANGSSTSDCATALYTTGSALTVGGGQATGGPIIQIPAFGTPVAIAHTILYSKAVTLDDNDLCGIFSGKITNFSQTENVPGSTHPAALNGAVTVVVRSDGSGTSFLMTQHLAKVCTSANTASGVTFVATKQFNTVFPSGTLPSNFVSASGSGAVAAKLITVTNAIAYLTPDYTSAAPSSVPNSSGTINAWTPNTSSPYLNLKTAKIYNTHQAKAYAPNAGGTTLALKSPNLSSGDTQAQVPSSLVDALNPTKWIPIVADPLQGYPIVGYTTLEFAQCYANSAIANEIKAWIGQLYGAGNKTNLTKEGFVAAPAGYGASIVKAFTKNTFGFNLDIQNAAICNTTGAAGTFAGIAN